jgi:hypothetical protein
VRSGFDNATAGADGGERGVVREAAFGWRDLADWLAMIGRSILSENLIW